MAEARSVLEWSQTSALIAMWGGDPDKVNPHVELARIRAAKERRRQERAKTQDELIEANLRHVERLKRVMEQRGSTRGRS